MLKGYKYRIFPQEEQKNLAAKIFGQVRFIYNLGLETKMSAYAGNKVNVNFFDLANQISDLKEICPWLKESPSQALQMALRNLDNAYTGFFKGKGFPTFRNKHGKQSFQLPQGVKLSDDKKQIFIPKLKWVAIDLHREFNGEIKTVTVSRTTTNKYFVSILVDTPDPIPAKKDIEESTAVGVDMGIKDLCILSDGTKFENKDFLKSAMNDLRIAQRSLARKQKGSNRYNDQKMVVALLHEKVRNQRRDYLHKISKYLVDNFDTICLEDLSVSGMMNNHNLARAISDMGWSELRSMIEYKASWLGKNISVIGRFEPSSKACSCCGAINKSLTLSDRDWTCNNCDSIHDRDINASKNIKTFGLRNKSGVAQSRSIDHACNAEAHRSLADG